MACRLWGHHVDNRSFREKTGSQRSCRCGERYLRTDGSHTRVRHTLSCFLGHHTYVRIADRDGHHEYVCLQCGHPLMFGEDGDPYGATEEFKKKVRYLCGLFGHRVHRVTSRDGFVEYACHCGHSFLKEEGPIQVIRHPVICVAAGHFVRYERSRGGIRSTCAGDDRKHERGQEATEVPFSDPSPHGTVFVNTTNNANTGRPLRVAALKSNGGAQSYLFAVPPGVSYTWVLVWCDPFNVPVAEASIPATP